MCSRCSALRAAAEEPPAAVGRFPPIGARRIGGTSPVVFARGRGATAIAASAFTRVHSASKTRVNALIDAK
jgi:hypothetical protein